MSSEWIKDHDLDTDYDYNVWSDADNKLTLTAYKLKLVYNDNYPSDVPEVQTDTERFESISFYLPDDYQTILFLMDRPDPKRTLEEEGLLDYDDWVSLEFLERPDMPDEIFDFIQNLQDYEDPKIEDYRKEKAL